MPTPLDRADLASGDGPWLVRAEGGDLVLRQTLRLSERADEHANLALREDARTVRAPDAGPARTGARTFRPRFAPLGALSRDDRSTSSLPLARRSLSQPLSPLQGHRTSRGMQMRLNCRRSNSGCQADSPAGLLWVPTARKRRRNAAAVLDRTHCPSALRDAARLGSTANRRRQVAYFCNPPSPKVRQFVGIEGERPTGRVRPCPRLLSSASDHPPRYPGRWARAARSGVLHGRIWK